MMILGANYANSTLIASAEEESNKEFISKYETWNLDLSEEELIQYYIDNDIDLQMHQLVVVKNYI